MHNVSISSYKGGRFFFLVYLMVPLARMAASAPETKII